MSFLFGTVLIVLAIFLILLVLVQRGRGGGLTGALGGMGGSSAFGAKAGDVFTRITIVTAAIWITICALAVLWANHRSDRLGASSATLPTAIQAPAPENKTTAEPQGQAAGEPAATPAQSPAAESPAPESPAPAKPQ
jgi:preprotein translocase subunit SecG